jgi:hypothetical protein
MVSGQIDRWQLSFSCEEWMLVFAVVVDHLQVH